jgi:hypothetical protein
MYFEPLMTTTIIVPVTEEYPIIKKLTGLFDVDVFEEFELTHNMAHINKNGIYFNNFHRKRFNDGLILRILFHELAHHLMHVSTFNRGKVWLFPDAYARMEVEAETVANTILKRIVAPTDIIEESNQYIEAHKKRLSDHEPIDASDINYSIERIYDAYLTATDDVYKKVKEA